MECPYVVHKKQMTQTKIDYDEKEKEVVSIAMQNNNAEFYECLGKECGAYIDDHCSYHF